MVVGTHFDVYKDSEQAGKKSYILIKLAKNDSELLRNFGILDPCFCFICLFVFCSYLCFCLCFVILCCLVFICFVLFSDLSFIYFCKGKHNRNDDDAIRLAYLKIQKQTKRRYWLKGTIYFFKTDLACLFLEYSTSLEEVSGAETIVWCQTINLKSTIFQCSTNYGSSTCAARLKVTKRGRPDHF